MYVTFVTVPKAINKMLSKPFVAARDDLANHRILFLAAVFILTVH